MQVSSCEHVVLTRFFFAVELYMGKILVIIQIIRSEIQEIRLPSFTWLRQW